MAERWFLRGSLIGGCNCDWGCPCSFDAPPTYGPCEGLETLVIREGRYGAVALDGLTWVSAAHFPGPIHEGNGVFLYVVDERATPAQRAAVETLFEGDGIGPPFEIFAAVRTRRLPTVYAPIEVTVAGIRSEVRVGGGAFGALCELALSRIKNPVTGEEEEIYVEKPTGFTWQRGEMGMTTAMRLKADGLAFDHSGRYAEFAEFAYHAP